MSADSSSQVEKEPRRYSAIFRGAVILGLIILVGLIFSAIEFVPRLSHVGLTILSGPKSGQYFGLIEKLATNAAKKGGSVTNVSTTGTTENLKRLNHATDSKGALFAIVPDGVRFLQPEKMELVARLPGLETVFFLGNNANAIRHLSDLKNMRIGIGPSGSGTALIAREILSREDLAGLNLALTEHTFIEQAEKLKNDDLDLGVFVTSENDPLIKTAIRNGLQIASFENARAWSKRYPALRVETLYSGHYDHVELLPKTDKKIFRIDTLVLGDRNASRSDVVALLVLLDQTFHGFIVHNKNAPNDTRLTRSKDLLTFIDNGGPSLLDSYAPGLMDFMPPANLLHYVVVVSVLMNLMTGWHRLRLYFLDSRRMEIEDLMFDLFGTKLTLAEIDKLKLDADKVSDADKKRLSELIDRSDQLRKRCRKYAPSFVTPLGQENVYRYHEGLITDQLTILRDMGERLNISSR